MSSYNNTGRASNNIRENICDKHIDNYSKERSSCPLCFNAGKTIFMQSFANIEGISFIDGYDVCECLGCGMFFANNLVSQEDVDYYYQKFNKYEADILSTALPHYQQVIVDYLLKMNKLKHIADFGCGTGALLRELHSNGFTNLYALDTSKSNCDFLRKSGIKAQCNSVFDINCSIYPRKLDVIVLCAVLEHIVDLHGFMNKVMSVLNDDGLLIICVPKIDEDNGRSKPLQEFSVEHINYFSNKSLTDLLSKYSLLSIEQLDKKSTITLVSQRSQEASKRKYIENSNDSVEKILAKLDYFIDTQTPVVIWGVGTLSRYLLKNTRFRRLKISAFVDGDIHYKGKLLEGIQIYSPNEISSIINDEPILLTTYNANDSIKVAIKQDIGLANEIICLL